MNCPALCLAFAGLLLPLASPVSAKVGDAAEAIVVTGRGLGQSRAEVAYDVTTIDRDRILDSASGRLEDVLRDVAGLQSFRRSDSRSANATSQSLTLRGLGGNASGRAQLILDGVPQSDPFGGWISFPAYDTDRLGQISVTRGGGSGIWGPGALAGTIEMESASPDELQTVDGRLAYGSRNARDARASVTVKNSSSFITASGALASGDGFVPIIAEDRGPVDRAAPYRQLSGAIRAVTAVGVQTELQTNVSAFDDRRDRGTDFTANRGRGVDGSIRLVGKGVLSWSMLVYGQRRGFESQSASIDPSRTTATLTNDQYAVPSTGWGGRADIVPFSGPVELRLGGDLRAASGETREFYQYAAGAATRRRVAGGRSTTVGGFADLTLTRGDLTANLSVRLDHWSISSGHLFERTLAGMAITNDRFADRDGWEPTGRVAMALRADDRMTLRAAAYRGWRLPTLNELYRPFRAGADATAANPLLNAELLSGAEVGADWALFDGAKASVTLVTGRLRGAIANVTIARGPGVFPGVGFVSAAGSYRLRKNLEAIRTSGAELGFDLRHRPWNVHFDYSYVDAHVVDDGAGQVLDGLRPAQTPNHQASATLGWSAPNTQRLSVTAREISRQYEDDLNRRVLGPAFTVDATASTPLWRHVEIGLRGENLFNRQVDAAIASDGTIERALPRSLWLEVSFR